jgi:hypothetical protein
MGYIKQSLGANEIVHCRARMPFIRRAFGWLILLLGVAAAGIIYNEGQRLIAATNSGSKS